MRYYLFFIFLVSFALVPFAACEQSDPISLVQALKPVESIEGNPDYRATRCGVSEQTGRTDKGKRKLKFAGKLNTIHLN